MFSIYWALSFIKKGTANMCRILHLYIFEQMLGNSFNMIIMLDTQVILGFGEVYFAFIFGNALSFSDVVEERVKSNQSKFLISKHSDFAARKAVMDVVSKDI